MIHAERNARRAARGSGVNIGLVVQALSYAHEPAVHRSYRAVGLALAVLGIVAAPLLAVLGFVAMLG